MKDLLRTLYKVNSAMLAGKGNVQGMLFTFALVGHDMFTPWSSLVVGDEESYLPNSQTSLAVPKQNNIQIFLFWK